MSEKCLQLFVALLLVGFVRSSCHHEDNFDYKGNDVNLGSVEKKQDWQSCQSYCKTDYPSATYFTWKKPYENWFLGTLGEECYCKTSMSGRRPDQGTVSGEVNPDSACEILADYDSASTAYYNKHKLPAIYSRLAAFARRGGCDQHCSDPTCLKDAEARPGSYERGNGNNIYCCTYFKCADEWDGGKKCIPKHSMDELGMVYTFNQKCLGLGYNL